MATIMSPVDARAVIRCDYCLLIQFETKSDSCRKCHRAFAETPPPPEPPPALAAVAVVAIVANDPTDVAAALARNLRARRLQLGLSQRQLAARLDRPRSYVSKTENEKATPTLSSLERLAIALEISIMGLLCAGEDARRREAEQLMSDPFIAEIRQYAMRLSQLQLATILTRVHDLALRRTAACA